MSFLAPQQGYPQQSQQQAPKPFGHCDSFFTESENPSHERHLDAREKARMAIREHQWRMAEHLSSLTANLYQDDVLEHMERMEIETLPDVNSIEIQTEIQWYMRPYLLDFMIEAHSAFQLLPESLYLAVNLLDRYCSKRVVYKRHYQLVGCAALLIAAKYGDRKDRVPTVHELKGMCCSLYEDEMFIQMEYHVLATLDWSLGHPTVDSFLQLALLDAPHDPEVEHMAWYISEIALFHKEFVSVLPSVLARSALALARCVLARPIPEQSEWSSKYDPMIVVNLSHKADTPSAVVSTKYAAPSMSMVSKTMEQFVQQQAELAAQPPPPTPPLDMDVEEFEKSPVDGRYLPHTPQKGQDLLTTGHMYVTSPFTPHHNYSVGGISGYSAQPRFDTSKLPVPRPTYEQAGSARNCQNQPWGSSNLPAPSFYESM